MQSLRITQIKESWLLFLPENEFHEIGLIFAKFLLIKNGYEVIYLGANVPYGSLLQLAEKRKLIMFYFFQFLILPRVI